MTIHLKYTYTYNLKPTWLLQGEGIIVAWVDLPLPTHNILNKHYNVKPTWLLHGEGIIVAWADLPVPKHKR